MQSRIARAHAREIMDLERLSAMNRLVVLLSSLLALLQLSGHCTESAHPPTLVRQLRPAYTFSPSALADGVVALRCTYTGSPAPEVTWTLNSSRVPSSVAEDGPYCDQSGSLFFSGAQPKHSGNYMCTGSNSNGNSSASTYITITKQPGGLLWLQWWMILLYSLLLWVLMSLCICLLYCNASRDKNCRSKPHSHTQRRQHAADRGDESQERPVSLRARPRTMDMAHTTTMDLDNNECGLSPTTTDDTHSQDNPFPSTFAAALRSLSQQATWNVSCPHSTYLDPTLPHSYTAGGPLQLASGTGTSNTTSTNAQRPDTVAAYACDNGMESEPSTTNNNNTGGVGTGPGTSAGDGTGARRLVPLPGLDGERVEWRNQRNRQRERYPSFFCESFEN